MENDTAMLLTQFSPAKSQKKDAEYISSTNIDFLKEAFDHKGMIATGCVADNVAYEQLALKELKTRYEAHT
eukprot:9693246-Karenia_brevis.AAC.1